MDILLWAAGWELAGFIASGFTYAYFWGTYPTIRRHRQDLACALGFGLLFGPVGLLLAFFLSGFAEYGWRLWP